jgi:hypothetical protein
LSSAWQHFLLLSTALTAFAGIFVERHRTAFHQIFVLAISAFYAIPRRLAILTVIGILRLCSWGRYSS